MIHYMQLEYEWFFKKLFNRKKFHHFLQEVPMVISMRLQHLDQVCSILPAWELLPLESHAGFPVEGERGKTNGKGIKLAVWCKGSFIWQWHYKIWSLMPHRESSNKRGKLIMSILRVHQNKPKPSPNNNAPCPSSNYCSHMVNLSSKWKHYFLSSTMLHHWGWELDLPHNMNFAVISLAAKFHN